MDHFQSPDDYSGDHTGFIYKAPLQKAGLYFARAYMLETYYASFSAPLYTSLTEITAAAFPGNFGSSQFFFMSS